MHSDASVRTMPKIAQLAERLAKAHAAEDPKTLAAFLAESEVEIRLVEVSASVGSIGSVLPFRFAATEEVPLESIIILLSEDEWQRVLAGDLALPEGWGTPDTLRKLI